MLSAERFVAPRFFLISCKLVGPACWLEGMVCSLQDVEEFVPLVEIET